MPRIEAVFDQKWLYAAFSEANRHWSKSRIGSNAEAAIGSLDMRYGKGRT